LHGRFTLSEVALVTNRQAVRCGLRLQDAQQLRESGAMPEREYQKYLTLWLWAAPRFGDYHGLDQWYNQRGKVSYLHRQRRAERLLLAIRTLPC
jgi:hypothetical protein